MDLKAIRFVEGTKISHDYSGKTVETFSYKDLIEKQLPAIGIPAKPNRLVIIDVDAAGSNGEGHKSDGREWWTNFCMEAGLAPTYTVRTRSGGFHFYYYLPLSIDERFFSPPARLAPGVDVVYNGWVAAPPSRGYSIEWGNVQQIAEAPEALLDALMHAKGRPDDVKTFDTPAHALVNLHSPYSEAQIKDLKARIEWFQINGKPSYSEWRDGLFALKAGIDDPVLLDELVEMWTHNRNYIPGDEMKAQDIVARAEKYGSVGPGTIFAIIKESMMREGATNTATPFSIQEIFDRSAVPVAFDNAGKVSIIASETNVAALLGAMFSLEELFHDVRIDMYVFKGVHYSDAELANILSPMIQSVNHGLGLQRVKKATIGGALDVLMAVRQIDPHKKYLKELVWDGVPRIDTFLRDYVGIPFTEYTRAVSKNMWIALAARGLHPGTKFDHVIVFEGSEGVRKSTLVQAIGGEYSYSPTNSAAFKDLDELRKMHQSIVVELPELIGLKGQDANLVKGFISNSTDMIRGLYARKAKKCQRGFILIGTTNDSKYLEGGMGGRRFWPIVVPSNVVINTTAIGAVRDQLFAEGIVRFKNGESFYEVPSDEHDRIVNEKNTVEPLTSPVLSLVSSSEKTKWRLDEIYQFLISQGYLAKGLNQRTYERIEKALRGCFLEEAFDSSNGTRIWEKRELGGLSTFI